jgi:hypothetical protein
VISRSLFSDSYTSLKLIRKKFLLAQIEAIKSKEVRTKEDDTKLAKLEKELAPIASFLADAKRQRDAILVEIGVPPLSPFFSIYSLIVVS